MSISGKWAVLFCLLSLPAAGASGEGTVREWLPGAGAPPARIAWTPSGGTPVRIQEPAARESADKTKVWRFDSRPSDKALAYAVKLDGVELKLEHGWFEFSYYLPADSRVTRLRPGVRVRGKKHVAADLVPVKGRWTVVRWPLDGPETAAIRRDGGKYAEALELGVLASGGPIALEIGGFAVGAGTHCEQPGPGRYLFHSSDAGNTRSLECRHRAARFRGRLASGRLHTKANGSHFTGGEGEGVPV